MPDNNYVWIVMEDGVSFPIAVFQKRYHLVSWMDNPENYTSVDALTILRFNPYGWGEYKIIDNLTLRAKK